MAPSSRPTQASLAVELGVSRQTLSNVLNHPEVVAPETKRRVEAAMKAAGYHPMAAGRALRTRRAGAIAMRLHPVVDGINGEVLDRFFHAVTECAQAHDYRINLFTAPSPEQETDILADMYLSGVIDGAVLIDSRLSDPRPDRLMAAGLPFVVFGRPWGVASPSHSWVDVDGRAGIYQATCHFREIGHTAIGFIGWPTDSAVGEDRREGWLRAGGDVSLQRLTENTARDGFLAAQELRQQGATALVCVSDGLALGALPVFSDGATPGSELPVIGFDNTPVARAIGLSSVGQPVEQAAELLVGQLIGRVEASANVSPTGALLVPSLVLRQWESIAGIYPQGKETK